MKKVITLILALVMVLGVSAVTMASNDIGNDTDVDVNVTVDPYAELNLETTEVNLDNIDPENNTATGTINYNVKANTAITVTSEITDKFTDNNNLVLSSNEDDEFDYVNGGINEDDSIGVKAELSHVDNEDGAWESIEAGDYSGVVTVTVAAKTTDSEE
ncbi:hypothetical protein [Halanaerobacter jeridensis]|uniref:Camelysin metallo-endopeptidase n=1 Tax=Halanaerobacter jeridensis TaxID=706427 RepID=A0A939BRT8_9FIRM|nr:hypothetical protein [Halanaerobacter jeridensis]MBM7556371.1 hypothetical protein [Halanaerobacter jeridensis]